MVLIMTRVATTIYLDKELLKEARKLAIDLGVTFSSIVETALKEYIEKLKRKT